MFVLDKLNSLLEGWLSGCTVSNTGVIFIVLLLFKLVDLIELIEFGWLSCDRFLFLSSLSFWFQTCSSFIHTFRHTFIRSFRHTYSGFQSLFEAMFQSLIHRWCRHHQDRFVSLSPSLVKWKT